MNGNLPIIPLNEFQIDQLERGGCYYGYTKREDLIKTFMAALIPVYAHSKSVKQIVDKAIQMADTMLEDL